MGWDELEHHALFIKIQNIALDAMRLSLDFFFIDLLRIRFCFCIQHWFYIVLMQQFADFIESKTWDQLCTHKWQRVDMHQNLIFISCTRYDFAVVILSNKNVFTLIWRSISQFNSISSSSSPNGLINTSATFSHPT